MPGSTRPIICSSSTTRACRSLLAKKLPFVPTVDDLVALEKGRSRRDRRAQLAPQAARAGGAPRGRRPACRSCSAAARPPSTSRTASRPISSSITTSGGSGPVKALQTAFLPAARLLNYDMEKQIGSIEKGKFADIIAVSGNPTVDVTEMERVQVRHEGRRGDPQRSRGGAARAVTTGKRKRAPFDRTGRVCLSSRLIARSHLTTAAARSCSSGRTSLG